jgi:transketolase
MRATFIKTLTEIASVDSRVVLLTGDLGFTIIEEFADTFPDRFFNAGVAEQNMIGMATGMAEAGLIPFCYSIVNFAALRPYEFIRNGPVLQHLPVRIVAIGGGFEYGTAGPSHHGIEDLAVMRALEQMTVIAPADFAQAATSLRATWDLGGPVYYRLGKDERTTVPGLDGRFAIDRIERLGDGTDIALFTTGAITQEVVRARDVLCSSGIDASVFVVPCLSPAPTEALDRALREFSFAVTVEAHAKTGGLGSLVCELVAEGGIDCTVLRRGISHTTSRGGSEAFLNELNGISSHRIAEAVREMLFVPVNGSS